MNKFDRFILDRKYIQLVGSRLERFHKTTSSCHQARCVACGDSKKSKTKTRLCFIEKNNDVFIYCQNCNRFWTVQMFLEEFFQDLYDEYFKELMTVLYGEQKKDVIKVSKERIALKELYSKKEEKKEESVITGVPLYKFLDHIRPILWCEKDSEEYLYLKNRGFTEDEMKYLFVTDDFKSVAHIMNPNQDIGNLTENEKRIIILFLDFKTNIVYALQGRSLDPNNKMKYITIKASDATEKIYCKEPLKDKPVICVEGPIDSLFIDNSVAACDSNLTRCKADIYVWDNEPYHKQTVEKIEKAISKGYTVCIWDFSPIGKVDINDLVKDYKFKKSEIKQKILDNSCKGMEARYRLSKWKRC